jgi:hypothetical protein
MGWAGAGGDKWQDCRWALFVAAGLSVGAGVRRPSWGVLNLALGGRD